MADIFDEIELKDVFDEVESDRIGDKIFEEVEKELPSLVRSYVKDQTKKIKTLTPKEISALVDAAISAIPKTTENKPIEKVIEKTIEKRIEVVPNPKKWAEVSAVEDLKKQIEDLKKKSKRENDGPDIKIVGEMLPNHNGISGSLQSDGNKLFWNNNVVLIGPDQVEGSWRFVVNADILSVQRYESGSWTEKGSFLP